MPDASCYGQQEAHRLGSDYNYRHQRRTYYLATHSSADLLYRKYTGGTITLECQTLHVMDNKKRIALVLTTTIDTSAAPTTLPSIATRYQFDNHLGTACLELDNTGAVITYEEYYPFGGTSYQAGSSAAEVSL